MRPAPKPAAERERPQLRPTANWQIDPITDTVGRPAPKQPPVRTVWRDEPQPVPEMEDPFVIRRRSTETAAADSLSAFAPKGFRIPDPIPVKQQDRQEPCKPTVGDADPGVPQADPGVPHDSVSASSEPENNPPDSLRLPPSLTHGGQEESVPVEPNNSPDDLTQDGQRESEPLVGDADSGVPQADPGVPLDDISTPPEPEPLLPVGPRVLQEKPKPKKRPPIGHPIVRMNG